MKRFNRREFCELAGAGAGAAALAANLPAARAQDADGGLAGPSAEDEIWDLHNHFSGVTGRDLEQYMVDMRDRIPLGRPGLQEDIAKACAFLCSEQAAYMTAECMNVSGGEEYH